jgi:hypothetical protein
MSHMYRRWTNNANTKTPRNTICLWWLHWKNLSWQYWMSICIFKLCASYGHVGKMWITAKRTAGKNEHWQEQTEHPTSSITASKNHQTTAALVIAELNIHSSWTSCFNKQTHGRQLHNCNIQFHGRPAIAKPLSTENSVTIEPAHQTTGNMWYGQITCPSCFCLHEDDFCRGSEPTVHNACFQQRFCDGFGYYNQQCYSVGRSIDCQYTNIKDPDLGSSYSD